MDSKTLLADLDDALRREIEKLRDLAAARTMLASAWGYDEPVDDALASVLRLFAFDLPRRPVDAEVAGKKMAGARARRCRPAASPIASSSRSSRADR